MGEFKSGPKWRQVVTGSLVCVEGRVPAPARERTDFPTRESGARVKPLLGRFCGG